MPDISCLDEGEHGGALPLLPLRCGRNAPAAAARGRQGWTSWEGKVARDREGKVACARATSHPKHPKIRPKIAKNEKLSVAVHGHEWTCAGKGAAQRAFVPGASAAHGHLGRVVASHAMLCCTVFASLASRGFTSFLSRSRNLG